MASWRLVDLAHARSLVASFTRSLLRVRPRRGSLLAIERSGVHHPRMLGTRAILFAAVLAALPTAAACGGSPPPTTFPEAAPAPDNEVALVAPGAEPKTLLRFHAAKGSSQAVVMTMKLRLSRNDRAVELPPMTMSMNVTVTEILPDGRMRYDYKMDKFDLGPLGDKLKDAFKGLEDLSGHVVVSDRGFVRDADVQIPPGASAETQQVTESLKQAMKETRAPFPAEPVGVGAKWDVTKKVANQGFTMQQVKHYELVSREGDRGRIKVTVVQTAEPQPLNLPNLPPGAKVELTSLKSEGEETIIFDTNKLAPADSMSRLSTVMDLSATTPQGNQQESVRTEVEVKIRGE